MKSLLFLILLTASPGVFSEEKNESHSSLGLAATGTLTAGASLKAAQKAHQLKNTPVFEYLMNASGTGKNLSGSELENSISKLKPNDSLDLVFHLSEADNRRAQIKELQRRINSRPDNIKHYRSQEKTALEGSTPNHLQSAKFSAMAREDERYLLKDRLALRNILKGGVAEKMEIEHAVYEREQTAEDVRRIIRQEQAAGRTLVTIKRYNPFSPSLIRKTTKASYIGLGAALSQFAGAAYLKDGTSKMTARMNNSDRSIIRIETENSTSSRTPVSKAKGL
jgi:hypothetical protein